MQVETAGMRPTFQPCLVNGPFADPALFVDVLFERRALLFDLGDISALPPRKILRTSHVFVTHTHMDHFVGFDRLLRICLGRVRPLTLFGPAGFVEHVQPSTRVLTPGTSSRTTASTWSSPPARCPRTVPA